MDISQTMKAFKTEVDLELGRHFDRVTEEAAKKDPATAESLEYVKRFALAGGKRLRAALLYYGYIAGGGTDLVRARRVSISIELVHLFLLIHDDVMDRDALRHGMPTVHEYYEAIARKHFPDMDARHFGQSMALVMGDMVGAIGNQALYDSGFAAERVIRALSLLQSIVSLTVIGQSQDFWIEYAQEATEAAILKMYENKTARYTIEGPLHLGYILAGGEDESVREALSRYALPLGIAFQIQDDVLGVFGDAEKIGKPVASDLVEGKLTLLVARSLALADTAQSERLRFLLKQGTKITGADVEEFRALLRETGGLASVQASAQEKILTSQEAVRTGAVIPDESREFLLGLADHMKGREY